MMRMRRLFTVGFLILALSFSYSSIAQEADTTGINEKPDSLFSDQQLPVITLSSAEMESDDNEQDISGLLQASRDIFVSTAGFTFGSARFMVRGYDSENTLVYMSGIPMNDMEDGRVFWGAWGGLNDATRNTETINGLQPNDFTFGGIGGATNIVTRASAYRKGLKATYSSTNRSYRNRVILTGSTGMMENDWAITVSGAHRWANEGYIKGTYYDSWAMFIAVEKKINDRHSVSVTGFTAPTIRGSQGASTQEVYDLVGSNFYNPYWGYQDGKIRNSRIKTSQQPYVIANHFWNINYKTKLNTAVAYSFAMNKTTSLNWYDAPDPRPDYYRYLPSYQEDSDVSDYLAQKWANDESVSQLNWDALYQANYLSGLEGEQSKYIIENRHDDNKQIILTSTLSHDLNERLKINGGIEARWYKSFYYKTVGDLLGGEYWVDIDQFAERDFSGDAQILQNDLNNPSRRVIVGERFGYDYSFVMNSEKLWAQGIYSLPKVDFYVSANASYSQYWRVGNMLNGRAPDNSYGESDKTDYFNYGIKGGATYKVTGRHFVVLNAAYLTRAPFIKNSYVSPRIKATLLPELENENISTADLSYITRSSLMQLRFTVYQTYIKNTIELNGFYHDVYRTFVNYCMQGVDKSMQGIELGADIKATPTINVTAVFAYGDHRYISRPNATLSFENGSKTDTTELVYLKNFYVPGTPQLASSVGIKYRHPKYWFFNVNANYYDKIYLDFNPERRTEGAVYMLGDGDPLRSTITEQQRLNSGFMIDASLGKSWKIKQYYINLNLSVNNILNNQSLITGGYEQNRFDFETHNVDKFPPKYYYAYGRNYFLNLSIRF